MSSHQVQVRPLSEERTIVPLSEVSAEPSPWIESIIGIPAPLEVPLLVIEGKRLEFDYSLEPIDFDALGPLRSLGRLASTTSGFLPEKAPNYRFEPPLSLVTELCTEAALEYARHDADAFRRWMDARISAVAARSGELETLRRAAATL